MEVVIFIDYNFHSSKFTTEVMNPIVVPVNLNYDGNINNSQLDIVCNQIISNQNLATNFLKPLVGAIRNLYIGQLGSQTRTISLKLPGYSIDITITNCPTDESVPMNLNFN
jgi:hypothetical protein